MLHSPSIARWATCRANTAISPHRISALRRYFAKAAAVCFALIALQLHGPVRVSRKQHRCFPGQPQPCRILRKHDDLYVRKLHTGLLDITRPLGLRSWCEWLAGQLLDKLAGGQLQCWRRAKLCRILDHSRHNYRRYHGHAKWAESCSSWSGAEQSAAWNRCSCQ